MLDLLKTRRSIRKFQNIKIEKEKIDAILKGALLSPSSRGRRTWEFIAVLDKETLNKLSGCRDYGSQFLSEAPLGIVVAADSGSCDVWVEDASISALIIQLAAQSLGLGSCWIQVRERFNSSGIKAEDHIKEILGIPERFGVECIIAIGYPDEQKNSYDENSLPYGKIHTEKF